jgi:hypothetical protein
VSLRAPTSRRDPGVEANARLTGATGLLLLVMLAAEGATVVSVRPLLAWHVALGLALIPPVVLKFGSTFWRFAHYYLGDARYRRAGPPVPFLRVLGPAVIASTFALLGTGVVAWVAGPDSAGPWLFLHRASFVVWFGLMTLHVLAHTLRATRLARADVVRDPGTPRGAGVRQGTVALSLVAGIAVAVATRGAVSGWTGFAHLRHH